MGTTYVYVNHDKQQYFDVGLFDWTSKHRGIGFGPGARMLAYLIWNSWSGHRISIVGDSSPEWEEIYLQFTDVTIEAELALIDIDGYQWLDHPIGIISFTNLCRYAILLRRQDIVDYLDETFGKGKWQRMYDNHCHGNSTYLEDQNVIEVGNRKLDIL